MLVNPGLGMGAEKGLAFFKTVLDYYNNIHFDKFHMKTICEYTTELLNEQGYQYDGKIEKITGLNIYPVDYFCPMNYYTGEISITENTCSNKYKKKIEEKIHISLEHNVLFSVWKNMYCYGIKGFVKKFVALTFRKER